MLKHLPSFCVWTVIVCRGRMCVGAGSAHGMCRRFWFVQNLFGTRPEQFRHDPAWGFTMVEVKYLIFR